VCGGESSLETITQQNNKKPKITINADTCIAVAGIAGNSTVGIKKYCIPKAQGKGVRGAPTEQWFVWYSEEWSMTVVDTKFVDTA
jgi:hypothetical protein